MGMRVAGILAGTALLVATLAGCLGRSGGSSDGPVPTGRSGQTITVAGRHRSFHLYRPAELADPAALVVMLHGGFGDGQQAERSYGWDAEADKEHFLVAYPDGVDRAWSVGGGCCGRPAAEGVDDVAFIEQLVAAVGRRTTLDTRRIFATGISNGGMMDYRLACDSDLFAAIGPDSATMLGACPDPRPVSVIHLHGTADHNIPYQGGRGDGFAHIDGPAVPALNASWRSTDRCAAPTVTDRPPVTTSTADCPGGRAVELITIDGAGHQWPGGSQKTLIQRLLGTDPPSKALNATSAIWDFFAHHPKP